MTNWTKYNPADQFQEKEVFVVTDGKSIKTCTCEINQLVPGGKGWFDRDGVFFPGVTHYTKLEDLLPK